MDIEKTFDRTQKLITGWFIFVGIFSIAALGGIGYLAYILLAHFGVI